MVKAIIDIDEEANQILNIVKAKENLKDKSQALNVVIKIYGRDLLEPELRPEFIERMKKVAKEKTIHVGNIENFKKRYNVR